MRILHVIASCDPRHGGPIEGVRRLGEAFRAMGHEQELLTLDTPDMPWVGEFPATVHAMGVPPPSGSGLLARIRRFARRSPKAVRWLRANAISYDGIIVEGLWNYSTRVARLALPGGPTPYVVFTHGMLDPWFAKRYPLKHLAKSVLWPVNEGVLLNSAHAVAFTCEQERKLARAGFRPWRAREVVVGFGTSAPPPRTQAMQVAFEVAVPQVKSNPYLLFLSRIHEKKGLEVLIDGFAAIAADHPDIRLVVAGPGEADYVSQLRDRAAELGLADRFIWPGMLSGEAKWGALYGCEAMVLTSHQENFGVVVVEALACGRRVAISDQVNIHDEITAAGAGFVGTDTAAGAAEILRAALVQTPEDRVRMEAIAVDLFHEKFEMSGTASRLANLLAGAGSEAHHPGH